MTGVVLLVLLICVVGLRPVNSAGKVSKVSNVAVPRGKSSKSKSGFSRFFSNNLIQRVVREVKISFCSELEALTLQITRPTDASIPLSAIDSIVHIMSAEYDDPHLVVSLLVKLSRKLSEPNVYTKVKTLLALHKLASGLQEKSQTALSESVNSLRTEIDEKTGTTFFAVDSIEECAAMASNVGELEAVALAREYVVYVFDFVDVKTERVKSLKKTGSFLDRAEALMSLLEQSTNVEESCTASPLSKQVQEAILLDRPWLVSQLLSLHEVRHVSYVFAPPLLARVEY